MFQQQVQRVSKLRVKFSTTFVGKTYNGLFKETSIKEMSEAKDLYTTDCISLFIEAIVDRCCGEEADGPVTDAFPRYFEIFLAIYLVGVHAS